MKPFKLTEFHVSLIRLSWRGFKRYALTRRERGW